MSDEDDNDNRPRLSDSEIAKILESRPPPPMEPDPKQRITLRVCPACRGEGLVPIERAEAYFTLVRLIRRKARSDSPDHLETEPDDHGPNE